MKQLIYLALPFLLLGCGLGDSDSGGSKSPVPYMMDDQLMSEGSATFYGSRYMYDYMRFRNPITGVIPANIKKRELEFVQSMPVKWRLL